MSPKQAFLENKIAAQDHQRMMQDPGLRAALLVAFNEICWRMPAADHPQLSWAANARREGAKELIETLLTLGTPSEVRKPTATGRLENEDGQHSNRTGRRGAGELKS